MGRGSADEISRAFGIVASRQGDVRGMEIESLAGIEVDDRESAALRALVSLAYENPESPGFRNDVINEAAEHFAQEGNDQGRFELEAADDLLAAMAEKGLIERTSESVGIFDEPASPESGWKPTIAGIQWLGAFETADWDSAGVEIES